MTHVEGKPVIVQRWPEFMRAETAAAFCDEKSVDAFLRSVGTIWPEGVNVLGKGRRWRRVDLEKKIAELSGALPEVEDAADVL